MNVRLKYSMSFPAAVYYGGETRMNNYVLTLNMITNSTDPICHNVAFERIKYFVFNCLDSTIFINQDNCQQCELFLNAGLSITTMPGEPVDQLIGLMLYYKLNAIMEDRIVITETEIASILGENMIYLHGEHETTTDVESIPEWWTTADTVHNNYVLLESDKIVAMNIDSAWRELDLIWPEPQTKPENGNIVVFADFNPNNETK